MENVKSVAESFKNADFLIKTGQRKSMKKVSQIFLQRNGLSRIGAKNLAFLKLLRKQDPKIKFLLFKKFKIIFSLLATPR